MEITETLYIRNRQDWRNWLENYHQIKNEIWLVYYKKHTGIPRIPYNDAVEEALCYGWIDSIVKRVDDEVFVQRFTPRKRKSIWSELNKRRVARLIKSGLMTEFGLSHVTFAKESGEWNKKDDGISAMPDEFELLLNINSKAKVFFDSLTQKQQSHFINWIGQAKQQKTKIRRSGKAIELLNQNRKQVML